MSKDGWLWSVLIQGTTVYATAAWIAYLTGWDVLPRGLVLGAAVVMSLGVLLYGGLIAAALDDFGVDE